jgi:hypothetical protein
MLPTLPLTIRITEVAPYITLSDIYDINLKYLDIFKNQWLKVAQSLLRKETDWICSKVKTQEQND